MDATPFNICWIVADDLGHGDLSCYGATAFRTPHIDDLADVGARYTHAHAASSVCTPSRYSILTGRYPWRSPLGAGVLGGLDPSILAGVPTVASWLQGRGYRTVAIGKWHLGLDWAMTDGTRRTITPQQPLIRDLDGAGWDVDYAEPFQNGPLDLGFDNFFGIAGSLDMPPYVFLEGSSTRDMPTVPKDPLVASQRPGPAAGDWVDEDVDPTFAARAVAEAKSAAHAQRSGDGTPLFVYLALAAPHRPCVTPERWQGVSGIGARADAICMIDDLVGDVVAAFRESPLPTLIVFTSDNGAPLEFIEDGDPADHAPNGPLRGQKADVYEGGHRVPLILATVNGTVPGWLDDGSSDSSLAHAVGLVDLFATMRSLLGDDTVWDDGRSLTSGGRADRVVGSQSFDGSLVLIGHPYKAAYTSGSGGFSHPVGEPCSPADDQGLCFDLRADPQEQSNVWHGVNSIVAALADDFHDQTDFDWASYPPERPRETDFRSGRTASHQRGSDC